MAARRPYRMTPARKAAIRKAQIASARKRKGSGKGKPVSMRRRAAQVSSGGVRRRAAAPKAAAKTSNRKRNLRRVAVASAAVAAAGGAAYTYKNREKMIVVPMAQRRFVKIEQRKLGRRLTKAEKQSVKQKEKILHASRSSDAARLYKEARTVAREAAKNGYSLNPSRSNYLYRGTKIETVHIDDGVKRNGKYGTNAGRFMFELYRKDVHSRAENRLRRMKGQKGGFSYKSGKQKRVDNKGRVRRLAW